MPFVNTGSGNWNDKKTWKDGYVPDHNTHVFLSTEGTVTLDGSGVADAVAITNSGTWLAMTNATLTLGSNERVFVDHGNLRAQGGTNNVGTMRNSGSVFVDSGATLKVGRYSAFHGNAAVADGGTLAARIASNLGDITLSSTGSLTTLQVSGTLTTELDPQNKYYSYKGGNVLLSDSSQNLVLANALTNVNNTISGAGTIRGSIVNRAAKGDGTESGDHSAGVIKATGLQKPGLTGNKLILELSSSTSYSLQNGGIIEAAGGRAGLVIRAQDGAKDPAKVQNTGLIAANAHSTLDLENLEIKNVGGRISGIGELGRVRFADTRITGGSLTTADSSVTAGGTSRLHDVEVSIGSDFTVLQAGHLHVTGGTFGIGRDLHVTENASLDVKGSKFSLKRDLLISEAGKLSFDGTLTLQDGANAVIDGEVSSQGATLRNVNEKISGSGTIRVAKLINDAGGLISGSLHIVLDDRTTEIINAGSIVGTRIAGSVTNSGSVSDAVITGNKVINTGTMSSVTFHTPFVPQTILNREGGIINTSTFGHTKVSNSGLIQASGAGSKIVLSGTSITGGTVSSSKGGAISVLRNSDETLVDVSAIGAGTVFKVNSGAILRLDHHTIQKYTLDNVSISVRGSTEATKIGFDGRWLMDGGSTIVLSNMPANSLTVSKLDIVHGAISGGGTITVEAGGLLDNQAGGVIEATGKDKLTIKGDLDNDGVLEADGGTLTVVSDEAIHGTGQVLVTHGGTVDLSSTPQFLGDLRYVGKGTILGPDVTPGGKFIGFATGDSYVFGRETKIKGELGTVWQANADHTGGTLLIKAGQQTYATLQMVGTYTSADFAVTRVPVINDTFQIAVSFVGPLRWLTPVSGNWQTASSWGPTAMFVPSVDDDALIGTGGTKYTVVSDRDVTVKSVATGDLASLFISGGTFTATQGTARATSTGTIKVDHGAHFAVAGTFTQSVNGKLVVDDKGSTIDIAKSGALDGGSLYVHTGAQLNAVKGSAALTGVDVHNQATINVADNTKLTLKNSTVGGGGSIAVAKGSTLSLDGSVVRSDNILDLGGALELLSDERLRGATHLSGGVIASGGTPMTLTNGGGIDGTGTIGDGKVSLVNDSSGWIGAAAGESLTISTGTNVVLNTGRIEASKGGSVQIDSALNNTGKVAARGGTISFNGAVTNGKDDLIQASGAGAHLTFKDGLDNSGQVKAEDEGIIELAGTIKQSKTAKISTSGDLTTLKLGSGTSLTGGSIEIGAGSTMFASDATITGADVSFGKDSTLWILEGKSLALKDSAVSGGEIDVLGTLKLTGADPIHIRTSVRDAEIIVTGKNGVLAAGSLLTLYGSTVTLQDGAKLISDAPSLDEPDIRVSNSGVITGDNGTIGDAHMQLANHGTIATAAEAGAKLQIDAGILNNFGMLSASVGGSAITFSGEELYNAARGTIAAGAGTVTISELANDGLVQAATGGRIVVQGHFDNRKEVEARGGGVVEAMDFQNRGTAVAAGDGSLLSLGASVLTQNSNEIAAEDGGTVLFAKGVNNVRGGSIYADAGGLVKVLGAATGGVGHINGDDAVLDLEGEFGANTTTNAVFGEAEDAGHGQLMLNNSRNFSGTVAGFAEGDSIDIQDIAFVAGRDSFAPNRAGGVLTIGSGSQAAKIQLLGDYMASDFAFTSDGHGGTLITGTITADPALPYHG